VIELSRVGLGTNNFGRRLDREHSIAVVHAALDAGVTHIDTANIYGGGESERFIGEALENRRSDAFLATKFGMGEDGNGSPEYVRRALDASLESLRTDHVDLLYYHRPDGVTPMAETVAAMAELVEEDEQDQATDDDQPRHAAASAPSASARAARSASTRSSRSRTGSLSAAASVSPTTPGIPRKERRPARKAATATSLAAL